jgi:hypothetical protein
MTIKWADRRVRKLRGRPLVVALAGLVAAIFWANEGHNVALGADKAVTCTNPASGTNWQIRIDYERSTVDSYRASITESKISWHDASDGGNYTLDRKSGNLTVVVASSTGGYFLYDRCKLDK